MHGNEGMRETRLLPQSAAGRVSMHWFYQVDPFLFSSNQAENSVRTYGQIRHIASETWQLESDEAKAGGWSPRMLIF